MKRSRRGRPLKLFAVASLVALACAGGLLLYLRVVEERPVRTPVGWQARVRVYAGEGAPGYADGDAARSRFADPFGVAVDREGNVYLTDAGASNRVRKITPEGQVTTLAGGAEGFADGAGAAASFNTPSALALDREGNLYVADTSNNRIRKIDKTGNVTTVAGDGAAGFRDGAAREAQFNGPVGVAVDERGNLFVADTYNDRIRQVTPDGQVKTLAGGDSPGHADGPAAAASFFDTPCAVAVAANGELYVADTGNGRVRKLTPDGQVSTLPIRLHAEGRQGDQSDPAGQTLDAPLGLALTHDGFLYVTEAGRGRVWQIAPDGAARVVAGAGGNGFAEGVGTGARFNRPAGLALDRRGSLYVADSSNYVLRKLTPPDEQENDDQSQTRRQGGSQNEGVAPNESLQHASLDESVVLPRLSASELGVSEFPWPLDPQRQWHEVVATMGEVRGSYNGEARHHLHAGVDVQGAHGATVRVVLDEKVASPLPNWGFGGLNEGVGVGLMTYVHLRVGRDQKDEPLKDSPFHVLRDAEGKASRVRVKRGTRLRVGDAVGTVNRMYHVHLNFGPWGAEANPLQLPFVGFDDTVAPRIERDGIHVLNTAGERLTEKRDGRLVVNGDVQIVVDAYDQNDRNLARRRLGLYRLGYQLLKEDGRPAEGFEQPRVNLVFDRLPPERDAVKLAYADSSGITVYGSAATRFLYVVTNRVAHGRAAPGLWRADELPPGRYTLRILAADYAGNEAVEGRDLPIVVGQK